MPELLPPTVALHASWLASRDEWGRRAHQDGAGLHDDDEVDSAAGFARWVGRRDTELGRTRRYWITL